MYLTTKNKLDAPRVAPKTVNVDPRTGPKNKPLAIVSTKTPGTENKVRKAYNDTYKDQENTLALSTKSAKTYLFSFKVARDKYLSKSKRKNANKTAKKTMNKTVLNKAKLIFVYY